MSHARYSISIPCETLLASFCRRTSHSARPCQERKKRPSGNNPARRPLISISQRSLKCQYVIPLLVPRDPTDSEASTCDETHTNAMSRIQATVILRFSIASSFRHIIIAHLPTNLTTSPCLNSMPDVVIATDISALSPRSFC